MTSRSKNAVRTFETEIEKCREDSNWRKAVDIAQQLKARSPQHESLSHFLIGEGKLEVYLEEWPPCKENFDRAVRELNEAKSYLTSATDENGKKAGVALDAHLLLGKLNYTCGAYEDALKNYKMAELDTLTEKELPVRSLRIVAESYAIKGLCLELTTVPGSSKFKQAEHEAEMIRNFELASDLTLLYLQKTNSPNVRAGPTLETALQRVPILHMRAGRLMSAVDRYREMLTAVESQSTQAMRLTLTRQLAEVLLRGVSGQVYGAPKAPPVPQGTLSRRREEYVSEGPWKPKKYAGLNQFVARNECEEVLLLLLIGEAMAVRDAVLSQSPEFERMRLHAYEGATAVYDLLALACVRWGQVCLLNESLERAMKFSFGEPHVWRQRALATAAAAAPVSAHAPPPPTHTRPGGNAHSSAVRAHSVMEHAVTLLPKDSALRLTGAKTCYQMGWIDEGLRLSEEAMAAEEKEPSFMEARCYLYVGIGYQMKAQGTNARNEKRDANDKSLKYLLKSVTRDCNDHLSLYYLALQYAYLGMLNEAMDATRSCLGAVAECAGGLRLLAALRSCGAAGGERALHAAALARHHHPACEWLARAHASLLLVCATGEEALAAAKELLVALKNCEVESENGYTELDAESDSHYTHELQSNRDANSLRASSAGVWRAERALSEGASSVSSPRPRAAAAVAAQRASAWLLPAELCLKLNRVSAAAGCVAEAAALAPFSHQIMHMRGMVHAHSDEWTEARQCFQNALAIHPTSVDTCIQLGIVHHRLGWLRLAEKSLRDAATLEPERPQVWRQLGSVLEELGEHEAAADCVAAALELDRAAPLLPFRTLPYVFQ